MQSTVNRELSNPSNSDSQYCENIVRPVGKSAHAGCEPPSFKLARSMRRRTWVLAMLVACTWIVLAGRLVQLQIFSRAEFVERATTQRFYYKSMTARPGEILDRRGRVLATTITAKSLFVVPNQMARPWPLLLKIADATGRDPDRLFQQVCQNADKSFLWVKRRLSEQEVEFVESLNLPKEAYGFRDEYLRCYPSEELAAHVLGVRDIDGVGRGGVEQSLDHLLRGRPGRLRLERDARGHILEVHKHIEAAPKNGRSVVLTIDAVLQLHVERELDRLVKQWQSRGAAAVVISPQTGELLAMASRPTFNPNSPEKAIGEEWKNRIISWIYEPGSTFKPCVVAWALDLRLIRPEDVIDCENGEYRIGRRVLHDVHPYGKLSVADILVKSSNIGMAKIGARLTNQGLYDASVAFGFGRKTGIEIPGELGGILRPSSDWDSYSTGSVPMGQEIAVTPLQLIAAYAALANSGRWTRPRILLADQKATPGEPTRLKQPSSRLPLVISQSVKPETADWMIEHPLAEVVRRGTGRRAELDSYTVFGKTGTAQKYDPDLGMYSSSKYISSFICGAPARDPQVLVLVIVDEPSVGKTHYGGIVAAPAAAEILKRALMRLRVSPDRSPPGSAFRSTTALQE